VTGNRDRSTAGRLPALGRLVARHRNATPLRKLAGLCRRYLAWHENHSFDLETNGEAHVLATLARFRPRTLLDAGANVGDWTLAAHRACPGAAIHAFEIAGPTFATLVANVGHLQGVQCRNLGLGDVPGSIRIRHYPEQPALTTSSEYPHPFEYVELSAEVVTGDGFAREHAIDRVDLLKIDVEGMEEPVLRGFDGLLRRRAIDLVQFEYGRVGILNHFLLRDFYAFFRERGYLVGKIFPRHVEFREYALTDENFTGPNYLACREDAHPYLEAFSRVSGSR
jgi:FkbM family methyltransferase